MKRDDESTGAGAAPGDVMVTPRRAVVKAHWAERVFVIGFAAYAVMAVLAHRYAYFGWDLKVAARVQSITSPAFETFMVWVSQLGSGWVPSTLVVLAGGALIAARLRLEGMICLLGVGAGALLNRLLKDLSGRPRPTADLVNVVFDYKHESFPSGHVVFFIEFFGFLFFLAYVLLRRGRLRRAVLVILGTLITLVGVSRVYLGAHWPSDVLGAYMAGGLWLLLMVEVYRRLKAKQATTS